MSISPSKGFFQAIIHFQQHYKIIFTAILKCMTRKDVVWCGVCFRDSGDDIELASCPHGQLSKEFSMVASCSCELLSEGGSHHFLRQFTNALKSTIIQIQFILTGDITVLFFLNSLAKEHIKTFSLLSLLRRHSVSSCTQVRLSSQSSSLRTIRLNMELKSINGILLQILCLSKVS